MVIVIVIVIAIAEVISNSSSFNNRKSTCKNNRINNRNYISKSD